MHGFFCYFCPQEITSPRSVLFLPDQQICCVYNIQKYTDRASHLDIVFLVFANTNKITALINRMIQSVRDSPNTLSGEIVADIPRIKRILKIFDPIALPSARPLSPFLVATMDVTSSGSDVPIAMIVSPISSG